jgi:4'-phosphopantetheinyl transferase
VSLAHAGELAVVALARHPVGVDVEAGDRTTWTRTEAVLKATGHGLDVDPSLVGLGPPDAPPRLVRWDGPGRRPALRLADVTTEDGYVAAVARLGRRPLRLDARAVSLS